MADQDAVCPHCSSDPNGQVPASATPASQTPAGDVHLTPDVGMKAFAEPYPSFGVNAGTLLPGRQVVQVIAARGTWVQIAHDGAVAGWVDGRGLVPPVGGGTRLPAPPGSAVGARQWAGAGPTAPPNAQVLRVTLESVVGTLGALAVLIGALLEWAQSGVVSFTSFKVPVEFLFDPKTTSHDPKLGLVLLVIGLAGVPLSFFAGGRNWRVLLGVLAVAAAGAYCGQIAANIPSGSSISVTDIVGPGPWVSGIGGIMLALSPLTKTRFARVF